MTVSRRPAAAAFAVLCVLMAGLYLSDSGRRRALFFRQIAVAARLIDAPPRALEHYGYRQDDPRALVRFRARAEAAIAGAATDLERIQRLGDSIYGLRRAGVAGIGAREAMSLDAVAERLVEGGEAQCGHRTWMLAALARSVGIDIRQIIWARDEGTVGHSSLEFFSRDEQRWIYFDLNLNGFATARGRALSAADLRALTASSRHVAFVSPPGRRAWTEAEFAAVHDDYAFDWYVMANDITRFDEGTRFGLLAPAYDLLMALPFQGARVVDLVVDGRETRLRVADPESASSAPALVMPVLSLLAAN